MMIGIGHWELLILSVFGMLFCAFPLGVMILLLVLWNQRQSEARHRADSEHRGQP